jgi:hypothetical protein
MGGGDYALRFFLMAMMKCETTLSFVELATDYRTNLLNSRDFKNVGTNGLMLDKKIRFESERNVAIRNRNLTGSRASECECDWLNVAT